MLVFFKLNFKKYINQRLIIIFFLGFTWSGANAQDNLNINQLIGKVDSAGIFRQHDYYLWCSSVIAGEDGKYHMFYARCPYGKRKLDDDTPSFLIGWILCRQ